MNRIWLALPAGFLAAAASGEVHPSFAGKVEIDVPVGLTLSPSAALSPWTPLLGAGMTERPDGVRPFSLSAADAPTVTGTLTTKDAGEGVDVIWTFVPSEDVRMAMYGVMGDLKLADYGGGTVEINGRSEPLPRRGEARDISARDVRRVSLADSRGGKRLSFDFVEPVSLFIQYWGGSAMSFRLILPSAEMPNKLYRKGVVRTLGCRIAGVGSLRKTVLKPVTIAASEDWIPLAMPSRIRPGSALDFSSVIPTDKPAGCHGRVVARGGHFEFEDLPGVAQRFYGVNLCGLANYPETLADAREMVGTIRRVGYNAVRIHHHDGHCVAADDPTGTRLDETMMARLDNLVAACSEAGVYITTDLFVSRTRVPISWKACGVDRPGVLTMKDFKYSVPVCEGVYSNYLAFAENWLMHRNVHTGRRLADEPALGWISLVNEGNIDEHSSFACTSRPGWREAWESWLRERKASEPSVYADITAEIPNGLARSRQGRAYLRFLQDVEFRFSRRTRAFLRRLGCRALVTNMNNASALTAAFEWPRSEAYDYVDTHFYVDHPRFLEKAWARPSWCPNRNPFLSAAKGASDVSALRLLNRPFTITEYNFAGPGRFRGVGGIATSAEAALQDWSGLWRFAWSHNLEGAVRPGARPSGYFDIASDPLQLASERASVCLFLRGDLPPLARTYAMTLPEDEVRSPDAPIGETMKVDWVAAAWQARIGAVLGTDLPPDAISAGNFAVACRKDMAAAGRDLFGADGEPQTCGDRHLRIDRANGSFALVTPRTAGGFAETGVIDALSFRAELEGSAATVWASVLDAKPLRTSGRILVTHLTDLQNSNARFADEERTILRDFGRLPYLMRNGAARIALRVDGARYRVWALAADGERREEVPATCRDGWLTFDAAVDRDSANATFLYEILREDRL